MRAALSQCSEHRYSISSAGSMADSYLQGVEISASQFLDIFHHYDSDGNVVSILWNEDCMKLNLFSGLYHAGFCCCCFFFATLFVCLFGATLWYQKQSDSLGFIFNVHSFVQKMIW